MNYLAHAVKWQLENLDLHNQHPRRKEAIFPGLSIIHSGAYAGKYRFTFKMSSGKKSNTIIDASTEGIAVRKAKIFLEGSGCEQVNEEDSVNSPSSTAGVENEEIDDE